MNRQVYSRVHDVAHIAVRPVHKTAIVQFYLMVSINQTHTCHLKDPVHARYLGVDSHLILRTSRELADSDPGLTGNLLLARMVYLFSDTLAFKADSRLIHVSACGGI